MKPLDPPTADYAFAYRDPPRSGNDINGLGVPDKIQAREIFHSSGREPIEWAALERFFGLTNPWDIVKVVLRNRWQLRLSNGPTAKNRVEAGDPQAMAAQIKDKAREFGAGIVGITQLTDSEVLKDYAPPHRTAIMIGHPMNREDMTHAPQTRAGVEVLRAYFEVARSAIRTAAYIRSLGWPAQAYGESKCSGILHLPLAERAGLGQLGKHGSLISREFGSNFRLSAVLTDMPLALDGPADIGVDDLCASCRRCVADCPPDAIFNDKQMVRGVTKWYVDFDKCVPYFTKTFGCAICIEVCPWSEPGRGPKLSEKLLAKRNGG